MREILFRGKRVDNGEWVEGNKCFVPRYSPEGSCMFKEAIQYMKVDGLNRGTQEVFEVHSETVGQYTGLKDKKGKKIFEGDKVLFNSPYKEKVYGVVDNEDYGYCFKFNGEKFKRPFWVCVENINKMYEVIGTIHDKEKQCK